MDEAIFNIASDEGALLIELVSEETGEGTPADATGTSTETDQLPPGWSKSELQGLRDFVAAIARAARDADDEFPKVVRKAKEILSLISDNIDSGTLGQVEASKLEPFVHRIVLGTIQIVGNEQIVRVVQEILSDRSTWEPLRQMTEMAPQVTTVANQVTDRVAPASHPDHDRLSPLVLGGAVILLAAGAGIILPLLAGPLAETILTNEVAIAAVIVGAAALIKRN